MSKQDEDVIFLSLGSTTELYLCIDSVTCNDGVYMQGAITDSDSVRDAMNDTALRNFIMGIFATIRAANKLLTCNQAITCNVTISGDRYYVECIELGYVHVHN